MSEAPAPADDPEGPMALEAYLAAGGLLSAPQNAPPRYRAELLRIMASFVDSEMAGAAGFADTINAAPGLRERMAAARIVAEKLGHAGQVLAVMATFGADTRRYATQHPWSARLPRDADIGASRRGGDMRLSVFHYPLEGWIDAVAMNVLMGRAVTLQLGELARVSYQPLAEAFRAILPGEARHAEIGLAGLTRMVEGGGLEAPLRAAIGYWRPRVAASFGHAGSARFELLRRMGLRHRSNEALLADWEADIARLLGGLGLD